MESDTTAWSEFPSGGNAIIEQTLVSEEKKSKRAKWVCESHSQALE